MDNLISMIANQVGGSNMDRIGSLLGVTGNKTSSALQTGVATLITGLASSASKPGGAATLLKSITDGGYDTSVFGRLGDLLGSPDATQKMLGRSEDLLAGLFGNNLNGVTDMVGSFLGLKSGAGKALLGLAAPLLMGQLGGLVKSRGLNATGLVDLLMGQRGFVSGLLPSGLGSLLGFTGFDTAPRPAAVPVREPKKSGLMRWLPWLALLVVALLLYNFCFRTRTVETVRETAQTVQSQAKEVARATVRMAQVVLPSGETVDVVVGSFNEAFANFLASRPTDLTRRFAFDLIEFETGSANLTARSREEVARLARIMAAYPAARVKLIGHTDSTGNDDENMRLSVERAESARNALVGSGIAADRIEIEGRGATEPTASNDTEAGRAQNRRVELVVTSV